jgi:hypothetical protein
MVILLGIEAKEFSMSSFRFLFAAIAAFGLSAPAFAAEQIEFTLPSGNIGCIYTPEGGVPAYQPVDGGPELSCDRVKPEYVRIILGPSGNAVLHKDVGDASCCSANLTLNYGGTWKAGPFICKASTKGLDCRRDTHGFFMGRRRLEAY